MQKPINKFRNKRFLMMESELFESEVYRSLTGKQLWVLGRFYQKIKRPSRIGRIAKFRLNEILNNGEIIFTYSEAEAFGISRKTFFNALLVLEKKGFIDKTRQGNPYGKIPSLFSISDRWKKYGQSDFKVVVKKRVQPKEYGFQPGNTHNPKKK